MTGTFINAEALGIALKLLDAADVKVGNFLPALVFAPAHVGIVSLVD